MDNEAIKIKINNKNMSSCYLKVLRLDTDFLSNLHVHDTTRISLTSFIHDLELNQPKILILNLKFDHRFRP